MINLDEQTEQNLVEVENKQWKEAWQALDRLHSNPDFKLVVLDGYFRDSAVNLVSMLANHGTVQRGERPEIMEQLVAISRLQDYFITIRNLGCIPEDDSESYDDALTA